MSIEQVRRIKKVREAITQVINDTNSCHPGEVAQGIHDALIGNHRTLQQSFIREFVEAMKSYSEQPSDMRNEGAVQFAKMVKENDPRLPYV